MPYLREQLARVEMGFDNRRGLFTVSYHTRRTSKSQCLQRLNCDSLRGGHTTCPAGGRYDSMKPAAMPATPGSSIAAIDRGVEKTLIGSQKVSFISIPSQEVPVAVSLSGRSPKWLMVFLMSLGMLFMTASSAQARPMFRVPARGSHLNALTAQGVVVFQEGVSPTSDYNGVEDAPITTWNGNLYANLGGLDYLQVGEVGDQDQFRTLIRFDLQGWPGVTPVHVQQAWLEVLSYDGGFDEAPQDVLVHEVTRSWLEGTGADLFADGRDVGVTWATARPGEPWTTPGGDFRPETLARSQVSANAVGWQRWDVTEAVRGWVTAPQANYGLLLEPEGAPWTHHEFRSSEWEVPDQRPRLVIHFTYEVVYLSLIHI